jgi:hypothetical protein
MLVLAIVGGCVKRRVFGGKDFVSSTATLREQGFSEYVAMSS